MAINFDQLPQDKPSGFPLLDSGIYKAKIIAAEVKNKGAEGSKDYLALTYDLTTPAGVSKGKLWDNMFDSDKPTPRYKIQRFCTALRLNLTGNIEFKDLAKIVVGKELLVDVSTDEKSEPKRNQVDVFKADIYYHVSELAALTGVVDGDPFLPAGGTTSESTASQTINAADAADATGTGTPANAPVAPTDY